MGERGTREQLQRRIVIDLAVPQNAAVPVIRVLAHADIRDDDQIRDFLLEGAHSQLHRTFFVPRGGAIRVFGLRHAEQD